VLKGKGRTERQKKGQRSASARLGGGAAKIAKTPTLAEKYEDSQKSMRKKNPEGSSQDGGETLGKMKGTGTSRGGKCWPPLQIKRLGGNRAAEKKILRKKGKAKAPKPTRLRRKREKEGKGGLGSETQEAHR